MYLLVSQPSQFLIHFNLAEFMGDNNSAHERVKFEMKNKARVIMCVQA